MATRVLYCTSYYSLLTFYFLLVTGYWLLVTGHFLLPPAHAHRHMNAEQFQCRRCGTCCRWEGYVLLTEADVNELSAHLNMTIDTFVEKYTRLASNRTQLSLIEASDGACCFLDGNACRVYPARPQQCRTFPKEWTVEGCPARS